MCILTGSVIEKNFYLSLSSFSPPNLLALFLSPTVGSHWEVSLSAGVYLFLNHVEHNCATFMSQPSPTLVNKRTGTCLAVSLENSRAFQWQCNTAADEL